MHILIAALHRPSKPTGVCRHAANLARCIVETERVTKVILIIGAWQQDYFKTAFILDNPKIELFCVDIKNSSLSRNIWFIWGLPKLVKQINPDIIHLSFPLPFFRLLFSCPVISTIHDFYPYECPENFGYPNVLFNRWFLKQCIDNSDGISCVSEVTLKNLHKYFPTVGLSQETAVVYNYVDFSLVAPSIPKDINIKDTDSFLLSVGQHRQNKNLDLLIKAYSQLRQNSQIEERTKLVIVGANGPETDKLQHMIDSLNLEEFVIQISSIHDRTLSWLYQNCELFVIPSSTEGFCLPLAEAIYFSCKVVCSDIPIFREIGSTNCTYFQFEEDSVQNLTEAIAHTLKQSCHSNALDSYSFTKEKTAVQYLKLYCEVIQANSGVNNDYS